MANDYKPTFVTFKVAEQLREISGDSTLTWVTKSKRTIRTSDIIMLSTHAVLGDLNGSDADMIRVTAMHTRDTTHLSMLDDEVLEETFDGLIEGENGWADASTFLGTKVFTGTQGMPHTIKYTSNKFDWEEVMFNQSEVVAFESLGIQIYDSRVPEETEPIIGELWKVIMSSGASFIVNNDKKAKIEKYLVAVNSDGNSPIVNKKPSVTHMAQADDNFMNFTIHGTNFIDGITKVYVTGELQTITEFVDAQRIVITESPSTLLAIDNGTIKVIVENVYGDKTKSSEAVDFTAESAGWTLA